MNLIYYMTSWLPFLLVFYTHPFVVLKPSAKESRNFQAAAVFILAQHGARHAGHLLSKQFSWLQTNVWDQTCFKPVTQNEFVNWWLGAHEISNQLHLQFNSARYQTRFSTRIPREAPASFPRHHCAQFDHVTFNRSINAISSRQHPCATGQPCWTGQ